MNSSRRCLVAYRLLIAGAALALSAFPARATYWSLFNIEGESTQASRYVTYASLTDMLGDTNRVGLFDPNGGGSSRNIVGSGSDGQLYWSLFNIEGESTQASRYVTYASLTDMLGDTNRVGLFDPNGGGSSRNIVGSGSDGQLYWSLFNIEGESAQASRYVTYASLADMLGDTNRVGLFDPNGGGSSRNIVGSGYDGQLYWSLFNIEGESAQASRYVTYASLADMLGDTNRVGLFDPNGGGSSRNIVGSGSDELRVVQGVPEPSTLMLAVLGLAGLVRRVSRN
jgi:rubrerythrin